MRFYCDGACNPNPGPMGIGVAMVGDDGATLATISRALGEGTNNIAEFEAVLAALALARERGIYAPEIFTDSRLVVEQVLGRYAVSARHLQEMCGRAARELHDQEALLEWIPREDNTLADRLSKRAIAPSVLPAYDVAAAQFERARSVLGNENAMRETARAVLQFLEEEPWRAEEALLAARFGYNGKDDAELSRFNARVRHGAEAVAAMEAALAHRSPATQLKALRWAGRGFPPAFVAAKLALEKALSAPFVRATSR